MGFAHRIVLTNAFDDRSRTALEVEGQFSSSALTSCNAIWPLCRFSYQNIIYEAVQSSFNVGRDAVLKYVVDGPRRNLFPSAEVDQGGYNSTS